MCISLLLPYPNTLFSVNFFVLRTNYVHLGYQRQGQADSWRKAAFKMSDFIASAQEAHIQHENIL